MSAQAKPTIPAFILPGMLFLLVLPWHWPTLPGEGLTLTLNLLTWLWCALWGLWLLVFTLRQNVQGQKATALLIMGALLMSLPWLWTPAVFRQHALYRLAGLWSLALLLMVFLQVPVRGALRRRIYALVAAAGVIQTLLATFQLLWPAYVGQWIGFVSGGRATGSLRQPNILGSLLASALACSLWLVFTTADRRGKSAASLGVVLLAAGVVMTQSRTALIGSGVAAVLLICLVSASNKARLGVVGLLLLGVFAGQAVLTHSPTWLSGAVQSDSLFARLVPVRKQSNIERLALLRGAILMIARAPVIGNGLGSFEYRFPQTLAAAGMKNPFSVTVGHPHNELLYVWSEGGLLALIGLLLWGAVLCRPFLRFRRTVAIRGILTLPIVVHCMTEMPLYLSAAHGVLLVILLRLALPTEKPLYHSIPPLWCRTIFASVLGSFCLAGALFMITGLQSAQVLREAERFRLLDPAPLAQVSNPYAQPDRLLFDRAVSDLMLFSLNQDRVLAERFRFQASAWLARHNDPNLTASLMQLAHWQHSPALEDTWRRRGCQSFARDPRFHCQTLPSHLSD